MFAEMLKAKIEEKGLTIADVSSELKIDKSTFYRKINGNGDGFTVAEVVGLIRILGLSADDVMAIFFAKRLA